MYLLKLRPFDGEETLFSAVVYLTYTDTEGQSHKDSYEVLYKLPCKEQFFTDELLYETMQAYYFVSELKHIIDSQKRGYDKERYLISLEGLKGIGPKQRQDELAKVINVVSHSK
jgi:hypothetical protein